MSELIKMFHFTIYLYAILQIITPTKTVTTEHFQERVYQFGNQTYMEKVLHAWREKRSFVTMQDLARNNSLAYIMWNITNKYKIYDNSKVSNLCLRELGINNMITPIYLGNVTLEKSAEFLRYFSRDDLWYTKGKSIIHALNIHENRSQVLKDQELYLSTIKSAINDIVHNHNEQDLCWPYSNLCACISQLDLDFYESTLAKFQNENLYLREFITLGSYIDLPARVVIIILGIILNGTLLYTFLNVKFLRNESNLVIFNLMIANLIMLVVYIPTNYVRMYNLGDHEFSRPFRVIQVVLVSANTMVIFVFNIKRYFDIYRIVNAHTQTIRLSTKVICIIYFGVIWVWSITLGITYCFLDIQESYNFLMFLYFLLYLIIFPIVLAVINSLTSRILLRSTEQCNNSSEMKNLTSSGVILSQTVTYFISHVAFFIYTLFDIEAEDTGMDYFSPTTLRIIMFCFHIIFFTYPCLNNLVLYKTSSTFRYFLNLYLFRCWYNPEEEQHVTLTCIRGSDTQE